jgi:hypothetical protein
MNLNLFDYCAQKNPDLRGKMLWSDWRVSGSLPGRGTR